MAEDERESLAQQLQALSGTEIDLVHEVLLRLTNEDDPRSPAEIKTTFERVSHERRRHLKENDDALDFLKRLGGLASDNALYADFQNVVERAGIILHIGSATGTSVASSVRNDYEDEYKPPHHVLEAMEDNAMAMDQRILTRDAFQALSSTFANIRMERLADQFYAHSLRLRALSHWLHTTRLHLTSQMQADDYANRNLLRDVLSQWSDALRWNKLQEQVEHNLKVKYFLKWVSTTRLHQYIRLRQENLLADMAKRWLAATRKRRKSDRIMSEKADGFRYQHYAEQGLKPIARKKNEIDLQNTQALHKYQPRLLQSAMQKWMDQSQQIKRNSLRAEDAQEYFSELSAFQKLRMEWLRRKILRRKFVARWRAVVQERKHTRYQEAYKRMRTTNKENIARAALDVWRTKSDRTAVAVGTAADFAGQQSQARTNMFAYTAVRKMFDQASAVTRAERQADGFSHHQNLHSVNLLGRLSIRLSVIHDNDAKADELNSIKQAETTRDALRRLKRTAFNMRRREEDAEAFRVRSERTIVSKLVYKWHRAVRANRVKREQEEDDIINNNDIDSGLGPSSGASSGLMGFSKPILALTPAVRRTQLLSTSLAPQTIDSTWMERLPSTTPAYTPGKGLTSFNKRLREVMRTPGTPLGLDANTDGDEYG